MAGTITHLLIARNLVELLGSSIQNIDLFYAGNIGPDGVHAGKDYCRADKKKTHLRSDIKDNDFHLEKNRLLFNKRLNAFKHDYIDKNDSKYDYYVGYLVHLLVDEAFLMEIRESYRQLRLSLGTPLNNQDFFRPMIYEVNEIDKALFNEHKDLSLIRELLQPLELFNIKDLISKEELMYSKIWVLEEKLKIHPNVSNTEFIKIEAVEAFIERSTSYLLKYLKDNEFY
jgi:hypothetical protein